MQVSRPVVYTTICLVLLSLVVNALCLSRLSELQHTLARLQTRDSSENNLLRAEIGGLRAQMASLSQAAEWYSLPTVKFEGLDTLQADPAAVISWTFRELGVDDTVRLSYRLGASGWQDAQLRRLAGNTFEARVPLGSLKFEPVIVENVHVASQASDSRTSRSVSRPVQAEMREERLFIEYAIHAKGSVQSRSGRTERMDISKLAPMFTAHVTINQGGQSGTSMSVAIRMDTGGFLKSSVRNVSASALANGSVLESIDLKQERPTIEAWTGSMRPKPNVNIDTIRVSIEMTDGTVSTKEISVR